MVILNKVDYEKEVFRQLNDETFYRRLQKDPTADFSNSLKISIREGLALDYINKYLSEYLYNQFPRVPVFNILPKVHKPGFPPAGRPIVAAQGYLHEPTSKYVDWLLQPFVTKMPTFIRDTTDFIRKVEGTFIPEEALLISLDVVSLYTNIPHNELRNVLQGVLDSREVLHPPTHFVLDLVYTLLEHNYFRYDDTYYLQMREWPWGALSHPVQPTCLCVTLNVS